MTTASRVALVSYDVQTVRGLAGGVGAFVNHFARILRGIGEEVTIVLTRSEIEPMRIDDHWKAYYRRHGIHLMEVTYPWSAGNRRPNAPFARLSEAVEPLLGGFDVAYFGDWGNTAFQAARKRRFSVNKGPVVVTVLHGPNDWVLWGNRRYPTIPGDLHLSYQERYAARHSDFVVSPSRHMVKWLSGKSWVFPGDVQVLGLPILANDLSGALGTEAPDSIDRVIFFGRIEMSKGFDMFVEALRLLSLRDPGLMRGREVILLGAADRRDPSVGKRVVQELQSLGWLARHVGDKDSSGAIDVLRENATRAICVVPSRADNFPYSVIEASLVRGLNLIACGSGGVAEVFSGGGDKQLCESWPPALADLLEARLHAPLPASELFRYNAEAANRRWIDFHRLAVDYGRKRQIESSPVSLPSVDICIPYYNKAKYLPQLLELLDRHTFAGCQVIVVNDGSPEIEAQRTFDEMRMKYSSRGWKFLSQPNSFVDAARNNAVRQGSADFLMFIDADDVPAPNAVQRMLEAITISGDDCLMTSSFMFAGDNLPFDATGRITAEPAGLLTPLGADLTTVLVDPFVLGVSMIIVRRSAFEAIGGYREVRDAGHEDWELVVRLTLAGYRVDVLPEVLHFYRQVESSLVRTMDEYPAKRRLVDALDSVASRAGIPGAAAVFYGMHLRNRTLETRIVQLERQLRLGDYRSVFITRDFFSPEDGDVSPVPVRILRNLYRHAVPLERRLQFHRRYIEPVLRIGRRLSDRAHGKG